MLLRSIKIHTLLDQLPLIPTRWDLATHCHGSLAKMEERWRSHDKIYDFSTNLGKNLPLPPLPCVSLSRNALSLSLKTRKNVFLTIHLLKKWEKSYLKEAVKLQTRLSQINSLKRVALKSHAVHWMTATYPDPVKLA